MDFTDGFSYREGALVCEGIPVEDIVRETGTPTYVYSLDAVLRRYERHIAAFSGLRHQVCYAVKANTSLALLQVLARTGAGFDVNSRGELRRALRAGADPARIIMTGVGKTQQDIEEALDADIAWFNAESASECRLISDIAAARGTTARVLLRLNPDVDAGTHPYISTGELDHKFGLSAADVRSLAAQAGWLPGVRIAGLAFHLGSQIFSAIPYHEALRHLMRTLEAISDMLDLTHPVIDIGGGFGVPYDEDTEELDPGVIAEMLLDFLGPRAANVTVITEPGRSLVANAGILVSSVEHVKPSGNRIFLILDAGMNDLLRPALYSADHGIVPLREPHGSVTVFYDVVGPVCESSDTFARRFPMPEMERGDLVALLSAGAYGASMSSTYNSRPLAAEAVVLEGAWHLARRRQSIEALLADERPLTGPGESPG